MSVLKDKIFAAEDIEKELVDVPQWGVTVEVRGLSGRGRARVLKNSGDEEGEVDLEKLYPALVIASTFDPDTSEQVFSEGDEGDILAKSGAALDVVASVAMRLSGLAAAAVEEAKKDSSSTENVVTLSS